MSEFREDPVSGDWVIIAPGRAKRPEELVKRRAPRAPSPTRDCPFEDLERSGNWPPLAIYPSADKWQIAVIPNKYPALTHVEGCSVDLLRGIYKAKTGVGDHEIVVTRDHRKNLASLAPRAAAELFLVFKERHKALSEDACNAYIATFFNWGREAGASLWHPHYQILALPIVPPHVVQSTNGAERYFKANRRCVRCDVINAERKEKKRVVAENRLAIAVAPYAAKRPFEISVLPKRHEPYFKESSNAVVRDAALLVRFVMQKMKQHLRDPDLNFFIHDAPLGKRAYSYHHWHAEIIPANVVSPPGGFEASTVVNINAVEPEAAAAILRGEKRR